MSNRRAPGQRLINLAAKSDFVELLDGYISESSEYSDRSQFIRDAIVEKVSATLGKEIPAQLALPPGRAGKGGAKPRAITSYREDARREKKASSKLKAAEAKIVEVVGRKYGKGGESSGVAE